MTAGKTRIVTRLHLVEKPRKHGSRWYVYAWRGGPCIHKQDGERPVIGTDLLDMAAKARQDRSGSRKGTFEEVITLYRNSPEFTDGLAASTRRDYRLWLDRISERFGGAPIGAFSDYRMRGEIIQWRNKWSSQPRTADKASVMMATLLGFAVENGLLAVNVAAKIKHLHSVNKADQVWEPRHWDAIKGAPAHLMLALRLASLTGFRLGDLVKVAWEDVGDQAIILVTNKRKGRAIVPILPELRALLDHIGDANKKVGPILLNSRGKPWTESGLGSVFQKKQPKGFDRTMHDLRGTYATWLAVKGMTDDDIARIIGWTAKRVATIRARYVDEARVIISMIERLSA